MKPRRKKTVSARKCSVIAMCDGRGETTHSIVIHGGRLMHYVGIGWIDAGPATDADRKKYPVVKD